MSFLEALSKVRPLGDEKDVVNVLVETPTGSRDKFDLNHEVGLFEWSMQLPAGLSFPFAFGFVPGTLAEDGDPLDIVLLVDGVFPQGVLVPVRLIGVLRAKQDEDGDGDADTLNHRVLAVPTLANSFGNVTDVTDLREGFYDELVAFFEQYNRLIGRTFEAGEPGDRDDAYHMLHKSIDAHGAQSGE